MSVNYIDMAMCMHMCMDMDMDMDMCMLMTATICKGGAMLYTEAIRHLVL